MTVLLTDAKAKLQNELGSTLSDRVIAHELIYADGTLLVDIILNVLQAYMQCVGSLGLEVYFGKTLEVK